MRSMYAAVADFGDSAIVDLLLKSGIAICRTKRNRMSNNGLLASGLVVFVCGVLVIVRAVTRLLPTSVRDDLTMRTSGGERE